MRGFSPGTITFLENQFGQGIKDEIVIVTFRKLIPQTKKIACNRFDDKSNRPFKEFMCYMFMCLFLAWASMKWSHMRCKHCVGLGLMLGRDCFRALFRKQFPTPLNWLKSGFSRKSRHGFEVGEKWVSTHFSPTSNPKTHFWTHFSPLTKTHLKPTLSANKSFSEKGPWGSSDPA